MNILKTLLFGFVALGPLGNLLTPHFLPDSFRIYYLLLPLFPLFFFTVRERMLKIGAIFLPFLIYAYFSANLVETYQLAKESHTLFRYFLLFCQFFFVLGAASTLKSKEEILDLIKTYLIFFFISVTIGYLFFCGYYLKIISFQFISRFSVLAQIGWGLLRFSPGSYPNEYGIVSSFALSILTQLIIDKNSIQLNFSRKSLYFWYAATFLAFLLTTTRAAYMAYFVAFIFLTWKSGRFIKIATRFFLFFISVFFLLLSFKVDMFAILSLGFLQKLNQGSLGERYFAWLNAVEKAKDHPYWGVGFASLTNLHNVYLQLLFELGLIGSILLIGSLLFSYFEAYLKYQRYEPDETAIFLRKILTLGAINVLSFAASNHNLNHHLTWFVFFLSLASLRIRYLIRASRNQTNILMK